MIFNWLEHSELIGFACEGYTNQMELTIILATINGFRIEILDPTKNGLFKGAIAPSRKSFFVGCRSGLGGSWQGAETAKGKLGGNQADPA